MDQLSNHVRDHYDTHAANTSTREERAKGIAAPLKRYHNAIKRSLLQTFATRAENLLDIACGRGGDLAKWDACGIINVLGVDISPKEIEEARRRYAEGRFRTKCTFDVTSTLLKDPWRYGSFDVITCMFALHYFCSTKDILRHVLENVSRSLRPGGYFIATVPDGKRVALACASSQTASEFIRLQPLWTGPAKPFGCAYVCDMNDTVTSGGSIEYLVDFEELRRLAESVHLVPITRYGKAELHFDPTDRDAAFKHFYPRFPASSDDGLSVASSLFAACVFQKKI